jgi:hypothetical protein
MTVLAPADVDLHIAAIAPAQLLQGLLERGEAGLTLRIDCTSIYETRQCAAPARPAAHARQAATLPFRRAT